jgi:hypothetical protein
MIEPLCRLCLEAGLVTPATVADHVEPHRGDFTAFRLGPLRSLCAECYNGLDRNNAPRASVREDGTPSDAQPAYGDSTSGPPRSPR